jgi:uncharacterized membrane protein
MVITIAILSLVGMLLSLIDNVYNHDKCDVNLLFPAILTIAIWEANITLAIITIVVTAVIAVIGMSNNS